MWAFGESLLVVRLFGAFCLWISCVAVFAIAARYTTRMHAALAAFLLIAVHSIKHGQYTSAELPATAALMGALWVCIAHKRSLPAFAAIGVLMSLATLIRSNLGVVPIAFGAWLAVAALRSSAGIRGRDVAAFGIAGLVPPAAIVCLYWHADALVPLWLGTLRVSASFRSGQDRLAHVGQRLEFSVVHVAKSVALRALHSVAAGWPCPFRVYLAAVTR